MRLRKKKKEAPELPEYGIFNDEGCLEDSLFTVEAAQQAFADWEAQGEPFLEIKELCPEHGEQPKDSCEFCGEES